MVGKYFSSGKSANPGGVLTLPTGFKIEQMTLKNPEKSLEFLATKSDLDIARIFGVPIELLSRSDGESSGSKGAQTESHRFFIKSSIQPIFAVGQLTPWADWQWTGQSSALRLISSKASNLREQGEYLEKLVNSGIIDKAEAKKML